MKIVQAEDMISTKQPTSVSYISE